VEKGRGFRLRDMFTGQERDVIERSASSNATRGDMLYGTVVSAGGVTVLDATASLLFSPDDRLAVLSFRKAHPQLAAAPSDAVVADWDIELRELYLALSDRVSSPTFPELQNTDGHPIEFQTVFYDIDSAQAAFDGLRHLAVDHSAEELESDIKRSAAGEVSEALVPWLRRDDEHEGETGSHTSLGQIHIGPRELRVEVNSVERAAIVRGIIEEALGTGARYRRSESTTVEEARHKHGPGLSSGDPHGVGPSADDSPELRELLTALLSRHYRKWVDDPLPALAGKSPRESVQDAEGRERVRALVDELERRKPEGVSTAGFQGIVGRVRTELGLEA
jgi:hypothetical protein